MYSALGSDPWAQLSFGESDLPDQVTSLIGYPVNVCELDSLGRNCRRPIQLPRNRLSDMTPKDPIDTVLMAPVTSINP